MRSATDRCRGRRRRPEQTTSPTCSRPCSWCPATKRSTDLVTCQMTLLTGCSIAVNADTCRVQANSPMCGVVWPGRFPAVSWWFRCRWSDLLEAKPGAGRLPRKRLLPTVGRSLDAATNRCRWRTRSSLRAALVPAGRLGDRFGRKKMLMDSTTARYSADRRGARRRLGARGGRWL